MLKISDTILLSSKKIKLRKISSFFSILFVALGAVILLVSSVAIFSIENYLDTTTKGIAEKENVVSVNIDCKTNSSNSNQTELNNLSQKIADDQVVLNTQKDLTTQQITRIQTEISDSQKRIDELLGSNRDKECLSKTLNIDEFKSKNSSVRDVFSSINYEISPDLSKTKDLKLEGIKPESERTAQLSGTANQSNINFLGDSIRAPILDIEETYNKDSDKYSLKNPNSFVNSSISNSIAIFDDSFLNKYLDAGRSLSSTDSDVVNVILPGNFLQRLDPNSDLFTLTQGFNPFTILTSSDSLEKANKYLDSQEKLKNEWLGKVVNLSVLLPNKVEYINQSTGYGDYSYVSETVTKYTKVANVVKLRVVGFSGFDNQSILVLKSEFNKINLDKLIDSNSTGYINADTISNTYYPIFNTKADKDNFLSRYSYSTSDANVFSNFSDNSFGMKSYQQDNLNYFVTNYASTIQQVKDTMQTIKNNVLIYIAYVFLAIAAIIMLMILSKTVTESTKEIAIFRSFGAKRFDIAKIYIMYTLMLVIIGFAVSLLVSYGLLAWMNSSTIKAVVEIVLYTAVTSNIRGHEFSFISFPVIEISYVLLISMIFGFIASIIPIYRAVKIQPIVAMRNE